MDKEEKKIKRNIVRDRMMRGGGGWGEGKNSKRVE